MTFFWNEEKNEVLKKERGISFERIVVAIEEGHLLDVIEHPNNDKYSHHLVFVVEISGYAICVPSVQEENGDYFLKTIFPSRKYTRQFGLGEKYE